MTDQYLYESHQELIGEGHIAERPLTELINEIQTLYAADKRPWIIGFSGGKDSTTILSLIYQAVKLLPKAKRNKPLYVVSSDTLVETPVVVDMILSVLKTINEQAPRDGIPMSAHPVFPKMDQTYWVNLLGRGYPAPTTRFRWCTERMKIHPVNEFITSKVAEFGEVILALGSRSQESNSRAQVIAKHTIKGTVLGRHSTLPNAFTYMPIQDWSADEVWEYLMSAPCPWGGSNRELFELYKGSNQGECPLVIDKSTPSCGNSRFGCWTCTVVTEDKALHGLIESGETWMSPLLEFRNMLWNTGQPEEKNKYRNFKRRTGKVTYQNKGINDDDDDGVKKHIPGPYYLKYRKEWLEKLLSIEKHIRKDGHDIELIKREELQAIRQEWLRDPNEPDWKDSVPEIYGLVYPDDDIDWIENDSGAFTEPDADLLKELELKHGVPAEMIMKLIEVELTMSGLSKRTGILDKLESVLNKDWGSLEHINKRKLAASRENPYEEKLEELKKAYEVL
jgi:DNA sulfur modification protein DndC